MNSLVQTHLRVPITMTTRVFRNGHCASRTRQWTNLADDKSARFGTRSWSPAYIKLLLLSRAQPQDKTGPRNHYKTVSNRWDNEELHVGKRRDFARGRTILLLQRLSSHLMAQRARRSPASFSFLFLFLYLGWIWLCFGFCIANFLYIQIIGLK